MSKATRKLRYRINKGEILPPNTEPMISGFKEPLTRIKDGFGYYGTLAYNKDRTHTQCFICGYYFRNLPYHISRNHKPVRQYRQEYGLGMGISLIAPVERQNRLRYWEHLTPDEKIKRIKRLRTKGTNSEQGSLKGGRTRKSLYQKNLEGRCPEQLLNKIQLLADKLGRTPTAADLKKEYGGGLEGSIVLTFGSWTEALRILGLTPIAPGSKVTHTRASVISMLIDFKKRYGREPYTKDLIGGLLPSFWTFNKLFGGLEEARQFVRGNHEQD